MKKDLNTYNGIRCTGCKNYKPDVDENNPKCKTIFGEYYCQICRLWSSSKEPVYHCEHCGICRKGKQSDFFHCHKCEGCFSKHSQQTHTCVEKSLHSQCPVCREEMFASLQPISVLPCGHTMHQQCMKNYLQTNYRCPLCKKSVGDLTELWNNCKTLQSQLIMPDEYQSWRQKILCNDCNHQCIVNFHIQFHECERCHSFNTNVIQNITENENNPTDQNMETDSTS
mgnify:CR=1 FL=1